MNLSLIAIGQNSMSPASGSSNVMLAWALVLIGVALVLFFVEILVPTGGILGLVSAVCLVAGIFMLFGVNTTLCLAGAACSLVALPFLLGFALKIWPHSPVGRWLMLGDVDGKPQNASPVKEGTPERPVLGATGQALTELRPVGTCEINGQRQECLATGGLIRAGQNIEVVTSDGMQVKVRAI